MSLVVRVNTVFGNKMVCTSYKMATTIQFLLPSGLVDFNLINLSHGGGRMGSPDYEGWSHTHTVTHSPQHATYHSLLHLIHTQTLIMTSGFGCSKRPCALCPCLFKLNNTQNRALCATLLPSQLRFSIISRSDNNDN